MAPPKVLPPMKIKNKLKRPVSDKGKDSIAKAKRCTILSLPFGVRGGTSRGQSMAIVRKMVKVRVIRTS